MKSAFALIASLACTSIAVASPQRDAFVHRWQAELGTQVLEKVYPRPSGTIKSGTMKMKVAAFEGRKANESLEPGLAAAWARKEITAIKSAAESRGQKLPAWGSPAERHLQLADISLTAAEASLEKAAGFARQGNAGAAANHLADFYGSVTTALAHARAFHGHSTNDPIAPKLSSDAEEVAAFDQSRPK